jgi:hypothetical protein
VTADRHRAFAATLNLGGNLGVLKKRSSIGFFYDGFKDNPSISREIFRARLLKQRKAVLEDTRQGFFLTVSTFN